MCRFCYCSVMHTSGSFCLSMCCLGTGCCRWPFTCVNPSMQVSVCALPASTMGVGAGGLAAGAFCRCQHVDLEVASVIGRDGRCRCVAAVLQPLIWLPHAQFMSREKGQGVPGQSSFALWSGNFSTAAAGLVAVIPVLLCPLRPMSMWYSGPDSKQRPVFFCSRQCCCTRQTPLLCASRGHLNPVGWNLLTALFINIVTFTCKLVLTASRLSVAVGLIEQLQYGDHDYDYTW